MVLLVLALLLPSLVQPLIADAQQPAVSTPDTAFPPVELSAHGAILVDLTNGQVLYGANIHEPRAIASLTKLMTAVVALQHGTLTDEITIQEQDLPGEASIGLQPGDRVTLETLLYGMLMRSGNDAAAAVARGVGEAVASARGLSTGGVETFVDLMNQQARTLGMTNSQFINPHGLDAAGHVSSPYDLALLTRHALKDPTFVKMFGARTYPFRDGTWQNVNRMLDQYDGIIGGKTGVTDDAGLCLVEVAKQENVELIAVVLDAPQWYNDVAALFDFGFGPAQALPRSALTGFGEASPASSSARLPAVAAATPSALATTASATPTAESVASAAAVASPTTTTAPSPTATAAGRPAFGASDDRVPVNVALDAQLAEDGGSPMLVQLGIAGLALIVVLVVAGLWLRAAGMGPWRRSTWSPPQGESEPQWRTYDLATLRQKRTLAQDEEDDLDADAFDDDLDDEDRVEGAAIGQTGELAVDEVEQVEARRPTPPDAEVDDAQHDVAVAHLSVAVRYVREGRLDAAESAFMKAIQVAPEFRFSKEPLFWEMEPEGFVALTEAYLRCGRPSDARAVLALGQVTYGDQSSLQAMEERLQRERRRAAGVPPRE